MHTPSGKELIKVHQRLTQMRIVHFTHHDLFTPQWWLLLGLLILPWILWWFLVDKTKLKQIWLFGSLLTIIIIILDDLGFELNLWTYPYQLINLIPRLNPVDLSVLPVLYMLIYQKCHNWTTFLLTIVICSFIFSYIFEPLFVKLQIYDIMRWSYTYSFPFYILIGVFMKWFVEFVLKKAQS